MEYKYIRLLSLVIKYWLLLPIKLLTISTSDDESPNNNVSNTLRKTVQYSLSEITYRELTTTAMMAATTTTTCTVCLSEVVCEDIVRHLRNCNHVFHKKCLDTWLDYDEHKTCPLCRAPLLAWPLAQPSVVAPGIEPSWAVERLLYLFGDDLMF